MDCKQTVSNVLHWNYKGFTEFPLQCLQGEEEEITDIYLKENLISRIPNDIGKLNNLESLYLSGNDITELPKEISKLTRLKCLDLSGNRLQYIPDEIGEMGSLKFLILDENELRQLPLRIAELRMLRYLSVCEGILVTLSYDNKLQWLPQRPVYNYYHCEFRFWRNRSLGAIPYSLWYHMFRGQQTRSLNIGCLTLTKCDDKRGKGKFVLRLIKDLKHGEINFPRKYQHVLESNTNSIPSLMEMSRRKFYQMLLNASISLSLPPKSIYSDVNYEEFDNNNYISNLQECFEGFNLKKTLFNEKDFQKKLTKDNEGILLTKSKKTGYCVPADIIQEHFYYLPKFIKSDLCNGPSSKCENLDCKKPIFDYVYFQFCLEKLILIENTEDIILSAEFCSKSCAESWKAGKNLLSWKLL